MYQYLIGTGMLAVTWGVLFLLRKDLRKAMLWSGLFYIVFLTIGFVGYRLALHDVVRSITPGYWAPPTLFGLGHLTHGYAIEDALFMLFAGGMVAALYPAIFGKKFSKSELDHPKKKYVLLFGIVCAAILYTIFYVNDVYILIYFNFFAALAVVYKRRDLALSALMGGLLFMAVYIVHFLIFNMLYPNFVDNYYHLKATSGIWLLGIPLEEYLYALTFGMIWGPFYAYAHGRKVISRTAPN